MNCAGPVEAVFEYTGIKHCDFYTSSNTAVSGNSTVDLFVIGFFSPSVGHFSLKLLHADLVLVEKVRMVASSLLVVYCTLCEIFGYRMCVYRLW